MGKFRHDPFAMLPFCGYNMGDYFAHWLEMGRGRPLQSFLAFFMSIGSAKSKGKFIWPGFGENVRVLKWMFERIDGKAAAQETPIGLVPRQEDLDLSGLKLKAEDVAELFAIDPSAWKDEIAGLKEYFK